MSLETLANEVESWIHQFYDDYKKPLSDPDHSQYTYNKIPDTLWQFIWITIDELKLQVCDTPPHFHQFLYKEHPLEKCVRFGAHKWVYFQPYYPDVIKQWILKIIESFGINEVDGKYAFTAQVSDRLIEENQQLFISTVCPGRVQNYGYFLRCLFQTTFMSSNLRTSGNNQEMSSLRYTKKRKPIEAYAEWDMHPETYQQCLQLFPKWPFKMSLQWCRIAYDRCNKLLLPELATICLIYIQ